MNRALAGPKGDSAELSRRAPFLRIGGQQAPVAQLDSASVFGTEGYRFESCRAYFGRCESSCGVSHKVQFANRFGTHTSHLSAVRLTAQPAGAAPTMRHVLSAVVQNVPGVLAHISGMLASRGYNIDSLAVGETEDPNLSRMTFVVVGDDRVLDQVRKQLEKIVTVVRVVDVSAQNYVERDLMLLKVQGSPRRPAERDSRTRRDLPRQDRRRGCRGTDDRDLRTREQNRGLHRTDAGLRHHRTGAQRPYRDGSRRNDSARVAPGHMNPLGNTPPLSN